VTATAAPPTGAEAVRPIVPVTESPPTAVDALSDMVETATRATVSDGDWLVVPLSEAVTLAVPAATPVIVNVALDVPAGIVTGDCTLATAGLLLVSVMVAAVAGAAAIVTVPCVTLPTPIVDALSVTADIAGPVVVGDAGELEPHPAADTAADSITVRARNGERLLSFIILHYAARTGPLTEQWLSRLCGLFGAGHPLFRAARSLRLR
jgi:hypothetical protein